MSQKKIFSISDFDDEDDGENNNKNNKPQLTSTLDLIRAQREQFDKTHKDDADDSATKPTTTTATTNTTNISATTINNNNNAIRLIPKSNIDSTNTNITTTTTTATIQTQDFVNIDDNIPTLPPPQQIKKVISLKISSKPLYQRSSTPTTTTTSNTTTTNTSLISTSTTTTTTSAPTKLVFSSLLVNERLRGSPIIQFLNLVRWEYNSRIEPDFLMAHDSCGLLLSLKDHRLQPGNLGERAKSISSSQFELRVVFVIVDVEEASAVPLIEELSHWCIVYKLTLIVGWSLSETARYIQTFKYFDQKPPDVIKTKYSDLDKSVIEDVLTSFKTINKTDATNLINSFGKMKDLFNSSKEAMSMCPGIGPKKVHSLFSTFHQPFKASPVIQSTRKKQDEGGGGGENPNDDFDLPDIFEEEE